MLMLPGKGRTAACSGSFFRAFGLHWAQVALWPCACLLMLLRFGVPGFAQFQSGPRSKLPVINKITATGPTRTAFTGKVESLDTKLKVLNVTEGHGGSTAIFPLNKKVKVSSISGRKLKVAALTPGTNVIVYYEQRDARRTVQQIIILGSGASPSKKGPHSS
jgi:hypothetical protein